MSVLSKMFNKRESKIGVVEKKLAELMSRKTEEGEFSVDLYYNDGADAETCYVAKFALYGRKNKITHHARCASFSEAIDCISDFIDTITNEKNKNNGD